MKIVIDFQSKSLISTQGFRSSVPFIESLFRNVNQELILGLIVAAFLIKGTFALLLHSYNIRTMEKESVRLTSIPTQNILKHRNKIS
jgi:hypothetical protein